MPKQLQLKFSPQEVIDEGWVNARFAREAGIAGDTFQVVWKKKSLDARGRAPFFLITADVYGKGEEVAVENGFLLNNVANAKEVFVMGAGPAGLFCALELIELGWKPVVLERGKGVKERRRDLAVMSCFKVGMWC